MCLCVGMCLCMQVPTVAREGFGFTGAGVIGGCETSDIGADKQVQVISKDSMQSWL